MKRTSSNWQCRTFTLHEKREIKQAGSSLCSKSPVGEDSPLASSNNDGGGSGAAINLTSICQKVDLEGCNPSSSQAEADPPNKSAESPLVLSNDAEASLPQEPVDTPLASSNNDGGGSGAAINLTSICQKVDFEDCNPSSSQAEADPPNELAESPLVSSNDAVASLPQEPVDTPLASSNNDGGDSGAAINLTSICQKVDFEDCNPSSSQAEADPSTESAESPLVSSNDAEASLPQEPVDTPLASSNNDGGGSGAAINLTSICQKVDFEGCNPSSSQAEADPPNELAESPLVSSNDDGGSGGAINLTSICQKVDFEDCNPSRSQAEVDPSTELAESPLVSSNDAEASLLQEPVDTPLASSNNDGGGSGAAINLTSICQKVDFEDCNPSRSQSEADPPNELAESPLVSSNDDGGSGAAINLTSICQKVDFEDCNPSSSQAEVDPSTELAESPLVLSNDAEGSLPQEPVDSPLASSNNDGGGSGAAINLTSICQKVDFAGRNPSSSQAEADPPNKSAESPLVSSNDAESSLSQEPVDTPLASSNNDGGGSGAAINLTSICQKVDFEDCNPSSSQAEADPPNELAESRLVSSNDAEASLPQEPVATPLASSNNDGGDSGAAINLTSICQKVDFEDCNPSSSQAEADPSTESAESPLVSSNDAEASLPQEPVDTPLASSNNDGGGSGAAINLTSICQKVDFEGCNPSSSQAEADPPNELAESPLVSSNDDGGSGGAINLTSICQKVDFEDCNPSSSQAEVDPSTELAESPLVSSNDAEASLPQEPVDTPLASSNNDGGGSGAAINLTSICQKVDFEDCYPSSSQAEADPSNELAELETTGNHSSRDEAGPSREPAEQGLRLLLSRDVSCTSSVKGSPKSSLSSSDSEESVSSVEAEKGSTCSSLAASLDEQVVSTCSIPISMTARCAIPASSLEEEETSSRSSVTTLLQRKIASRDSSPCSSYGEKAAYRDSSPCSSYGEKAASWCSNTYSYGEKAASWCSNTTSSSLDDNITPRRRSRSAVRKEMMAPRRSSRSSERANKLEQFNRDLLCDLLSELMNHKDGWPFVKPVPKSQFPDYHSVVRRPMDFMTIRARLSSRHYRSNMEFLRDVMLIFTNWEMYNSVDEELTSIGRRLQNYFYKRCKELNLLKCLSKESTRL